MTVGRIAVDELTGDIYAIDSANDVINRFDRDGRYLSQIRGASTTSTTFSFAGPADLAVDNSFDVNGNPTATQGRVYVANGPAAGTTFAFDRAGAFLWERAGGGRVCGVDVRADGSLYNSDLSAGVQQISTADGSPIGAPIVRAADFGAFQDPCNIAFDSANDLYVRSRLGSNIEKLQAPSYALPGTNISSTTTGDVAVNRGGDRVYITVDAAAIRWWDPNTVQADDSPVDSGVVGRFYFGITMDKTLGRFYVSDQGNNVVEIWNLQDVELRVEKRGGGTGTVRTTAAGIDCGATCTAQIRESTVVELTATPTGGATFAGWIVVGDNPRTTCTGTTSPCRITMNTATSVVATFNVPQRRVSVSKTGTGTGTVASTPAGINCGADCSESYDEGRRISLRATPSSANITFTGWSGVTCDGGPTSNPCEFTVGGSDINVRANFDQNAPTATLADATGIGETSATIGGSVTPNGATTICSFEWGPTAALGSTVACSPDPGTGTSAVAVTAALSGLSAATTYHYRLVTRNAGGTTTTETKTFTTRTRDTGGGGGGGDRTCATDPALCVAGVLSLASGTATVRRGAAGVQLACSTGDRACTGTLRLTARVRVRGRRGRRARTRTITVGTATYDVANGTTETVNVRLSGTAKSIIARSGSLRVTLRAGDLSRSLTLRGRRARRRARGRR